MEFQVHYNYFGPSHHLVHSPWAQTRPYLICQPFCRFNVADPDILPLRIISAGRYNIGPSQKQKNERAAIQHSKRDSANL